MYKTKIDRALRRNTRNERFNTSLSAFDRAWKQKVSMIIEDVFIR